MGRLPRQVEARLGDIGQAIIYLAQADHVTGVALSVVGGLVMH
jgi:hypothetical protein